MKAQIMSVMAAALLFWSSALFALQAEPFSKERFDQLQADNARILIDVHADWCPTCARQQAVLKHYQEKYPDSELVILKVDFDEQKEWVTHFRAPRQSTLILYQGEQRKWFSVAETRADVIVEALNKE